MQKNPARKKPVASFITAESRRRAEAQLRKPQRKQRRKGGRRKSLADTQRLLHDLQVHEIELEMQNEELQATRNRMEALLQKYTELYDFAPIGYFSLDEQGRILEVNLTGAALLGGERARLVNRSLARFVAPAGRPILLSFLKKIFSGPRSRLCEATLLKADGTAICASFHGTSDRSGRGARKWCRVAVLDITARKQEEQALQAARDELERRVKERSAELQRNCVRLAHEIEERKRAQEDVGNELRFEALLADISTRFVNLPPSEVDREMVDAQRRVFGFLGLDVSGFWQWSTEASGFFRITDFSRAGEAPRLPERMSAQEYLPWLQQQVLAGRTVSVCSMKDLPPEAARDRKTFRQFGFKSNLTIPLAVGGESPVGAVGFSTTRAVREWPDALIKRLQLVAQIFANALARKRADQALRESEERMRMSQQAGRVGTFDWNINAGVSFWTPELEAMYGLPPGGFAKTLPEWERLIHPDDRAAAMQKVEMTFQTGQPVAGEWRVIWPDGSVHWLVGRFQVFKDQAGQPLRMTGVNIDITERKRTEDALRASELRYRNLVEMTGTGYLIIDVQGRVLDANQEYVRICGHGELREIIGRSVIEWTAERAKQRNAEAVAQCAKDGLIRNFVTEYADASGRSTFIEVNATVEGEGESARIVSLCRDITERKETEAELLRERAELAHVARVSTMGELAASLAHELNQPLGAMLANAEAAELFLQQNPPALDDLRAILADIRKDDQRAGEVIRRMRALLRKHELERAPIEINSLVEDVLQLVSGDASLRGVSLSADLRSVLPQISGDRVHLQQVLLNLILNGMDAMAGEPRERRRITVRTRFGGEGMVELAVVDSGHGIEPDKLPRLFEPFYTTKPHGMGMGLSIAHTIIAAHRGRIWAENNPSGGAVFRITLPAVSGE